MPDETTDQSEADQAKAAADKAEAEAKADAAATAEAEAAERAAQDAADQAALRAAHPMRFSAPNLIGGRIQGFDVGDRLSITDSACNDGVHVVASVEDGWLVVRGEIHDEPPTPHALIAYEGSHGDPA